MISASILGSVWRRNEYLGPNPVIVFSCIAELADPVYHIRASKSVVCSGEARNAMVEHAVLSLRSSIRAQSHYLAARGPGIVRQMMIQHHSSEAIGYQSTQSVIMLLLAFAITLTYALRW